LLVNKKGISPLIATVLIIGFTIVLAVLVITWISGTVKDQTDTTDCTVDAQNKCLGLVGALSATTNITSNDCVVQLVNSGSDSIGDVTVIFYAADGSTLGNASTGAISGYGTGTATLTGHTDCTKAKYAVKVHSDVANGCDVECALQEVEF